MSATPVEAANLDRLTRSAMSEVMSLTARLMVMGYSNMTYERLKAVLFRELTGAMREEGLSQRTIATLVGETLRTFYNTQKRSLSNCRSGSSLERQSLRWQLLLFLSQRRRSRAEVLARFAEEGEGELMALLEVLVAEEEVFEAGGRGGARVYFAPQTRQPIGDPASLETALCDHIGAVGRTLHQTLRRFQTGEENDSLGRTYTFEVEAGSEREARLAELVERFEAEADALLKPADASPADEGSASPTKRVTVYLGRSSETVEGGAQ